MAEVLSKHDSPLGLGSALIFASCRKQGLDPLRKRFASLEPKDLSPVETWVLTHAIMRSGNERARTTWTKSLRREIPAAQNARVGCERGAWSLCGEDREESLVTTLYMTLTLERNYQYPSALLFQRGFGN